MTPERPTPRMTWTFTGLSPADGVTVAEAFERDGVFGVGERVTDLPDASRTVPPRVLNDPPDDVKRPLLLTGSPVQGFLCRGRRPRRPPHATAVRTIVGW